MVSLHLSPSSESLLSKSSISLVRETLRVVAHWEAIQQVCLTEEFWLMTWTWAKPGRTWICLLNLCHSPTWKSTPWLWDLSECLTILNRFVSTGVSGCIEHKSHSHWGVVRMGVTELALQICKPGKRHRPVVITSKPVIHHEHCKTLATWFVSSLSVVGLKKTLSAQYHRMAWVVMDLKDHLVPTLLPWAGTSSTRPGCSKPHTAWPWKLSGMENPHLHWETCSSSSPLS